MTNRAPDTVDVSVLMPMFNEERYIRGVVEALRAQTFEGSVEFLLIDRGSTDRTIAELAPLIEGDPRFRLFDDPETSVPRRLNLGLREARGEVIVRMDAHSLFPPNYLADGVKRIRVGDVASVSGPQIAVGAGPWSRRVALAIRSRLGRGGAQFRHLPAGEIDVDSGYCGFWQRSLLTSLGGWDEQATGAEDTELAARVRRTGGRIVCLPEMAALYMARDTPRGLATQYWNYAYRRAWIARRYPEVLRRSHVLPPALLLAVAIAAVMPVRSSRLARRALTLYAAALLAESVRIGRDEPLAEAASVPAVLATMHLAWGGGFLAGCLRHGPPWAALIPRRRRSAGTD